MLAASPGKRAPVVQMYRLRLRYYDVTTMRLWRDFVQNELLKRGSNESFDLTALYSLCTSGALLIASLERRFAIILVSIAQVCNAALMIGAHIGARGLLARRGCVALSFAFSNRFTCRWARIRDRELWYYYCYALVCFLALITLHPLLHALLVSIC